MTIVHVPELELANNKTSPPEIPVENVRGKVEPFISGVELSVYAVVTPSQTHITTPALLWLLIPLTT